MRGFLVGIVATLAVIVLVVLGIVNFVVDRSSKVVSNVTDPAVMQANYESLHDDCNGVRTLWQQYQDDNKAVSDYTSQNAAILTGTSNGVAAMQVRQQLSVLQTVAQGDKDQLATAAGNYDNTVETKTKNIGAQWIKIMFFDTGLPQSIQPPYANVDCGSGVWPSQH